MLSTEAMDHDAAWPWSLFTHLDPAAVLVQDTDPGEVAGNGPDSKTIERYLEALCRHGKAQKLVIPVTLTTSTVVTKDMLAYVKPHVQVNDALIEQVLFVFPLMPPVPSLLAYLLSLFYHVHTSYTSAVLLLLLLQSCVPSAFWSPDPLPLSSPSSADGFLSPCLFFLSC